MEVFVPLSHVKKTEVQGSQSYCRCWWQHLISWSGLQLPRQIRIKNKRAFLLTYYLAFQGVTLPLSMTRVKDLTRIIGSKFILPYQLLALFVSMRRVISVLGARWPLAAQSRNIVTCDPWPKVQESLPTFTALPDKGLWLASLGHMLECGWQGRLDWQPPPPWLTSSPVWECWGSITKQGRRDAEQTKPILFNNICCFFLEWK